MQSVEEFNQRRHALKFPDSSQIYRDGMMRMDKKRPFLSRKGYMGMGPVVAQRGDVIVIFMGSWIPHILRPKQGDKFAFLGEAYCDGVMDGELMGTVPQQTFWLD